MTTRAEMNPARFFVGLAILLVLLGIQIFFISVGWYFNLALAALIACAFVFEFSELLVLDLVAVFLLNWQPAPSTVLVIFALIPLAAYGLRKVVRLNGWMGTLIAVILGFLLFYILAAPSLFWGRFGAFALDVVVAAVLGELVFGALA